MTTAMTRTGRPNDRGAHSPIEAHSEVRASGRVVAWADTEVRSDADGHHLGICIGIESGHQPPWARRLLVHDLLTRAAHQGLHRIEVALPLGDCEILDVVRSHSAHVDVRAAGSTCLVEADLKHSN